MEKDTLIETMNALDPIKEKRAELIAELKKLEKEKVILNTHIQQTKDAIRANSDEYIQQYIKMFYPGSTWFIDSPYQYEYFRVKECTLDSYVYREEDIDECMIDIHGSYVRLPNPMNKDKDKIHAQYQQSDVITFKIKEIPHIHEISWDMWAKVLDELIISGKI